MKMSCRLLSGLILSLSVIQQASAYIFSFSNHTDYPIKVRIKLQPTGTEPWEEETMQSKQYYEYRWTSVFDSSSRNGWKAGFCLGDIQIAEPMKQMVQVMSKDGEYLGTVEEIVKDKNGNIKWSNAADNAPLWANVVIEYIESQGYNAMLGAAESFASSLQSSTRAILEAAGK